MSRRAQEIRQQGKNGNGNGGPPAVSPANPRSNDRDNIFNFDISKSGGVSRDLAAGDDQVIIKHDDSVDQIRLTFTSSEVGNGNPNDSNTMANQDGGLAVRVQAEDGSGNPAGPISRFDDEGITFTTKGDATFDVRDISGTQRGDYFDEVILGTSGADTFNETGSSEEYYINGGMGNDTLTGGINRDFLVGGAGNDTLDGKEGNDSFIGGGGNDTITGGIGDDLAILNVALNASSMTTDGSDSINLGAGDDTVSVAAPAGSQIRLTFTSSEVGNGNALDANLNPGDPASPQDGGLAVRLQLEGAADTLVGAVSRVDDEGISFTTTTNATFDVRDLISGAQRGDRFDVVTLGTEGNNTFDESGEAEAYYINAGMGNDTISGGLAADFLVGGAGNDRINGNEGNDSFIGGGGSDVFIFTGMPGDDRILDFLSGTDKIDFSAYGIEFVDEISTAPSGLDTIISVDSDDDGTADFTITLVGVGAPAESDYIF